MRKIWLLALALLSVAACARAEVQINEIMANNGIYENGNAYEWIELKNTGASKVSLQGYTLKYTRKGEEQVFDLKGGTLSAGGYAVVYCIENDAAPNGGKDYYAPLDLSRKGGTVTLYRDGQAVDSVEYGQQYGNISFGRVNDDGAWHFLAESSRGGRNTATGYDHRTATPIFSVPGGVYDLAGSVALSAKTGAAIRYTTDGTEPTETSTLYTGPIPYARAVTCIRAKAFESGALPSETVTNTYFVALEPTTPIVSLVTDEKYLTNSKTGLLVPGNGKIKNYNRNWEYPISVEYFDLDGQQLINQIATFRVTGATSRSYGQKSISIFARSAYGSKYFSFNPFENRESYTGYRALTLRAAGTESFLTRFRDALLTSRAKNLSIAYQESQTVIVYINGQYWGQYNLRERINKHFLAQFEGITDDDLIDQVTIIKGRGEVQQGTIDEWNELISFCKKNNLNKGDNLAWIEERLDIDNFFTHVAIQMITGNTDIGNQRYYKFPGGKWKCVLYDLDAGMQNLKKGPISYYNKSVTTASKLFYHEPFAALMKVPDMKEKFFTIMGQVILQYLPQDLTAEVDAWTAKLEPLMAAQIKRWPKCSPKSLANWQYEVKEFRRMCAQRPSKVVDLVCSTYKVSTADKKRYFADFYEAIKK
ncbi:MAG: CotH kinase family protein [Clostridia bacterium]|nr:CotH kinase family protein [Clostridia bacterium]